MFRIGGFEPADSNHGQSPQGDTTGEQQKAMDFSHGKTARGWPLILPTAMQGASSGNEGTISRRERMWMARHSCVHK